MNNTKKLSGLACALLLATCAHTTHGMNDESYESATNAAKVAGSLLCAGGVLAGINYAAKTDPGKKAFECLNISKNDAIAAAGLTTVGVLGSILTKGSTRQTLSRWARRAPLLLLLSGVTSTKAFNTVAENVPFFGPYLGGCENEECKGVCQNCKGRKTMVNTALYMAAQPFLDQRMNRNRESYRTLSN